MGLVLIDTLVAGGRQIKQKQSGDSPRSVSLYHCHKGCCLRVLGSSWFRALILARKYKLCVWEMRGNPVKVPITKVSRAVVFLLSLLPYFSSPSVSFPFTFVLYLIFTFFLFLPLTWGSFQACGGSSLCRHSMHAVGGYDGACTVGHLITTLGACTQDSSSVPAPATWTLGFVGMWDRVVVEIAARGFPFQIGYG